MTRSLIIATVAALAMSACNSKPATDSSEEQATLAEESVSVPTDSITAAVEHLNNVFSSGQSSAKIDSITFRDGVLTFYSTCPAGFLDDKESTQWLPSMAVNDLPLLGQGALQQILDSNTSVMCKYVDKDDSAKTYSFKLSQKDISGKLVK